MLKIKTLLITTLILMFYISSVFAQANKQIDIAKKIRENTPESLPQEPVAIKLTTDAKDENLKGKVKIVSVDLEAPLNSQRRPSTQDFYNEQGFFLKKITFLEGLPSNIDVYGYLEGNRVSKDKMVQYKAGERPNVIQGNTNPSSNSDTKNKSDYQYSSKYTYKYSNTNQLKDSWVYNADGSLSWHYVYNYKENQIEILAYTEEGLNWKRIEIFDKNGNNTKETWLDKYGKIFLDFTYTYKLDAQGNWIEQRSFSKDKENKKSDSRLSAISYRTIEYYP
jgi:hypothetical protein